MLILLFIIGATIGCSFYAWKNPSFANRYMGYPFREYYFGEKYRLFTAGLLHAGLTHLFINMYFLQLFGVPFLEDAANILNEKFKSILLITCYFGGIFAGSFASFMYNYDKNDYRHLGASAGVSGVMAAAIIFDPYSSIRFIFFPIAIPKMAYLIFYMGTSFLLRNAETQVEHRAHFVGSLWGAVFALLSKFLA